MASLKQKSEARTGRTFEWARTQDITTIETKPDERWMVQLVQSTRGAPYINVRQQWRDHTGRWNFSRKGITVHYEQVPDVIDGLMKGLMALEHQSWEVINDNHNTTTT